MRNKELSNFSNAELSQFSNLELKIKQMEEIADILSHSEMTIPVNISNELAFSIHDLLPNNFGQIITLPNVIHVGRLILNTYSQHTGELTNLTPWITLFDEIIQYFCHKGSDQ